jgi:opacity protein-like surface antigen
MRNIVRIAILLLLGGTAAAPAHAQAHWFGGWAGRYTDTGRVTEPGQGELRFGEAFALGAGYGFVVAAPLTLGVDASFASPEYEAAVGGDGVIRGRASFLTLMATGRLLTGGSGPVGFYLKGGAGGFFYRIPDRDLDSNFAFETGAGIDYRLNPRTALNLEWGRFHVYHSTQGIETQRVQHSLLRLGVRFAR